MPICRILSIKFLREKEEIDNFFPMLLIGGEKMRYPVVKQNGLKNCGPCSLASIIRYYNGYISVDALEDMMNTTKNGTNAYDLVETARKLGFESYGMKVESLDQLKLPLIAHVTIADTYNHFVVVYKVDNNILIGDPISGLKYMTKEEFYNIWNHIVIILKPLKCLPYNKPKSLFKYINNVILKYKYTFIYLIIISIFSAFISLIYSLLIKYIIDNISILNQSYILFIFIFSLKYILIFYKNNISINLNKKISIYLTNEMNESLISLPYIYYKNHRVGEIVSRFNDLDDIVNFINNIILSIIELPFLIIFLLFMFYVSKVLFLIILFIILIYVITNITISLLLNKNIKIIKQENASYNSLFIESLNAFETIKGINIEDNIIYKLNRNYEKLKNTLCKYQNKYNVRNVILNVIINIGSLLIIFIGYIMYHYNSLSIGTIISFYLLYSYINEPLDIIMSLIITHKEATNASRRIQELFYQITSKIRLKGNIEYKNVNYRYGSNNILKNINIKINKGEKVSIIGSSGAGKSTFVKLLKGYLKTNDLFIGNKKVLAKLENVSYISQNETLFEDTLYNNLICDDDNKIDEICNICLVNKNLNMYIEENGFNLSGGEKARIVIARALLKPFDILIIDEVLGEVDINTERIILKNVFNKFKDKTIIVVTHRLDNLDLFDHLIEIEDGKVKKDILKERG